MRYFEELGARVEEAWSARSRDEDRFPDVAAAALEALPPRGRVELEALWDEVLDPGRGATRQLAPLGAFGQPGLTTYFGRGFVIDVYVWAHALSAIHDHPFRGVFTLLDGYSVHARYAFEPHARLGARARVGALSLEALEVVEPGQVERFGMGRAGLVHALIHVPIPTVSMVVRTIRTEGYFRYFPPGVALAMDEPDEVVGRPLALLDTLRAAGDPGWLPRLERFVGQADFEVSFRALSRAWGALEVAARERLLDRVAERHGAAARLIAPAIEEALRAHEADTARAGLADADDRFIATAFVVADGRDALLALVGERHEDPVARLHTFIDEAGLFAPDEAASAIIAHALVDGSDEAGALERLRGAYGPEAVEGREDEIARYARTSMWSPLLR